MQTLVKMLDRHLGRCPWCMRQAFLFMLAAIGLALLFPLVVIQLIAAGAVILWLSHLTAFALRSAAVAREHQPKRRYALVFVRDLLVVAAVTVVPFQATFAQKACRCPSNAPKCCYNYSGSDYVCAPSNGVCCAGNPPHYCRSGQQCHGTSGCR